MDAQDSRSQTQKVEADAKTRRETAQVLAIEKARQKEDAQPRNAQAKLAAEHKKSASRTEKAARPSEAADGSTPKVKSTKRASKTQPMKKEPEFFVARTPADKVKPAPRPK